MEFYIISNVFIGLIAASAYSWQEAKQQGNVTKLPIWAINSPLADNIIMFCAFAPILAVLTAFIDRGLWGFAAILEIFVGYIIAGFLPEFLRNLTVTLSPIFLIIILGALWNFWYI